MVKRSLLLLVLVFLEIMFFLSYFGETIHCPAIDLKFLTLFLIVYAIHLLFLATLIFDASVLQRMAELVPKNGYVVVYGFGVGSYFFATRIFIQACTGR